MGRGLRCLGGLLGGVEDFGFSSREEAVTGVEFCSFFNFLFSLRLSLTASSITWSSSSLSLPSSDALERSVSEVSLIGIGVRASTCARARVFRDDGMSAIQRWFLCKTHLEARRALIDRNLDRIRANFSQ